MKQESQKRYWMNKAGLLIGLLLLVALVAIPAAASSYAPMMAGKTGYSTSAAFTVGETINGYQPIGILDGTAAFNLDENTVRVMVNHETGPNLGYAYQLGNGTEMAGVPVFPTWTEKTSREIVSAGWRTTPVYDRSGELVTELPGLMKWLATAVMGLPACLPGICSRASRLCRQYLLPTRRIRPPAGPHGGGGGGRGAPARVAVPGRVSRPNSGSAATMSLFYG